MLTLRPPLEAYHADLSALPGRSALGSADGIWIVVASGFWRLAQLPADARPAYARSHAAIVRAAIPEGEGAENESAQHDRAIAAGIADALERWEDGGSVERLAELTRNLAEREEDVGAFRLAYATVGALRRALPDAGPRVASMLLARQGRIVRQLGDATTAAEHYALAESLARSARDPKLRLEARLGIGVLANVRGNYPEARAIFERVLRAASRHGWPDLVAAAHQGLLSGAVAARDSSAALHHGWEALRGVGDQPPQRARLLANLGEACALAGEWEGALRAYAAASAASPLARVRLPALGGAAVAAARLGRRAVLDRVAGEAEREIARSQQPYENALTLVELAEAYHLLGDSARGEAYRATAAELARAGGYHEVRHRVESLLAPPRGGLTATGRGVVRSLEALELEPAAARMVG